MANTRISDLTASAANLAATDVLPVVQTTGVGPVKMTGTQLKSGIIGAGSVSVASGKTFTVSNTLTLTGTDASSVAFGAGGTVAYTADNLGVFAATTSAQLAGVISDETGSGALVFGTSPTFTTSAIFPAGTVSAPGITTTGDTNTGVYFPGADILGLVSGGSERVRLGGPTDATPGGLVVNSNFAVSVLTVSSVGSPATSGFTTVGSTFFGQSASALNVGATTDGAWLNAAYANNAAVGLDMRFMSAGAEKARIASGGNIVATGGGLILPAQATPTSKNAAATLTGAELITGALEYTGAADTITLPTGTTIEGALTWYANNVSLDWSVINTGSGTCTIAANGNTTVGALTVTNGTSGRFRIRRTATNTFTVYRMA